MKLQIQNPTEQEHLWKEELMKEWTDEKFIVVICLE